MNMFLKKIAPLVVGLFLFSVESAFADVTLLATGDILPQASWSKFCIPESRLLKDVTTTLFGADVVIGNLETPLTNNKDVTPNKDPDAIKDGKDFVFKCTSAKTARDLKDAGFTALTLANNHMMDYNGEGLSNTLAKLKKVGVHTAGAGKNIDEAEKPCVINAGGMKFIVFAASDVVPKYYDATPTRAGIASIKDDSDMLANIFTARAANPDAVIVLCLHWGVEATFAPTARQQRLAHDFIDAGADLILGSHPHRIQGVECYKGRPIFYSLGNFQFDCKSPGNETFIAKVVYKDGNPVPAEVSVMPVFIGKGGYPRVLEEGDPEYKAITDRYNDIANQLGTKLDGGKVVPLPPSDNDLVPEGESPGDYSIN